VCFNPIRRESLRTGDVYGRKTVMIAVFFRDCFDQDRLRTHVLVALSSLRRSSVDCVVCSSEMPVYHDFPLLDGLFFESPMKYNSDVRVEPLTIGGLHRQPLSDAAKFYLSAVCFKCLQVRCRSRRVMDV